MNIDHFFSQWINAITSYEPTQTEVLDILFKTAVGSIAKCSFNAYNNDLNEKLTTIELMYGPYMESVNGHLPY